MNAVGRAYERLAYTADYEKIDLIEYLRQIVGDLEPTVAPCTIRFAASGAVQFAADRAILVGLIVTELASNAGRYAYPDRGGSIWVQRDCSRRTNNFDISSRRRCWSAA